MKKQQKIIAKYIHILYSSELKFSTRYLNAVFDSKNIFNPQEHLFVTPHKNVYQALKSEGRIILDVSGSNLLNKYSQVSKWLVTNPPPPNKEFLLASRKARKKTIVRYWGNSTVTSLSLKIKSPTSLIKNLFKIILFRFMYSSYAAIGVANTVDILDISRIYKSGNFYIMPLGFTDSLEDIIATTNRTDFESVNIVIGQKGTPENNHIKIINCLNMYSDNNFKIYIPVSYGNDEYIKMLKKYICRHKLNNVIMIEDMMSYTDYVRLLNKMDIAIYDGLDSYALGNIAIMLSLKKKIYLNASGIIKQAFDKDQLPYGVIDDIGVINYKEFIKPCDYSGINGTNLKLKTRKEFNDYWGIILKKFN